MEFVKDILTPKSSFTVVEVKGGIRTCHSFIQSKPNI